MKTRSLLLLTIALGVISMQVDTFATSATLPPDRPNIVDLLDITDVGGTVNSTDAVTYIMVSNETNSINPVKEVTSVDVKYDSAQEVSRITQEEKPKNDVQVQEELVTNEDFNNDAIAAVMAKEEEDVKIAEQKRIEEEHQKFLDSVTWLSDYNIEYSDLSNERLNILAYAHQFLGIPYVWGGTTPAGFDCSGYTSYVLAKTTGILLPRTTYDQIDCSAFKKIPISEALPGDIVFNASASHTGFFIKDCGDSIYMMHAPYSGTVLKISQYKRPKYVYRYLQD